MWKCPITCEDLTACKSNVQNSNGVTEGGPVDGGDYSG